MRSTVWTDARSNGEPRLSEYVRDVTAFVLHFEQSGGRIFVGAAGYLLINLRQNLPNRRRHVLPVAAQEEDRSLPIELTDFFALAPNAIFCTITVGGISPSAPMLSAIPRPVPTVAW